MSPKGLGLACLLVLCPNLAALGRGEGGEPVASSRGFARRPVEVITVLPGRETPPVVRLSLAAFIDASFTDSSSLPGASLELGLSTGPASFGLTAFFSQSASWVHETRIEDRYRSELVGSELITFKDAVLVEVWRFSQASLLGAGFYSRRRLAQGLSTCAACAAGGALCESGPGLLLRAELALEWRFAGLDVGCRLLMEYASVASRRLRLGAGAGFSLNF